MLDKVHFSCRSVCWNVTEYDVDILWLTMSVYERFERPSQNKRRAASVLKSRSIRSAVLIEDRLVTDGQTDRQTQGRAGKNHVLPVVTRSKSEQDENTRSCFCSFFYSPKKQYYCVVDWRCWKAATMDQSIRRQTDAHGRYFHTDELLILIVHWSRPIVWYWYSVEL